MKEWKEYKYTDICSLIGGGTPKTSEPTYWGGNIPWLSVKDFGNEEKYVYTTEKSITDAGLKNSSTKLLRKDDIIISARGTIGAIAMLAADMAFNQSCFGIRSNALVDQQYLYYLTKTKIAELQKNSHGSVFDTITRETFAKICCCIPPKDEQERIASILSSLDDKIEVNRRINDNFYYQKFLEIVMIWMITSLINDNLEQQAQALFDKMFPSISFGEDMIGSYIIPKRGKGLLSKDAVEGNVPVIAGGLEPSTYHNEANTIAPVLTISASGANAGYVNLWHIPVWSSDSSFIDSAMTSNVYFWYVMLKKRQKEIFDAQTGSAQPHIYPKHIAEMSLGKFVLSDVDKFTKRVSPMYEIIGRNIKEIKRLAELRDTLLPKLMSGELKVSEINK